MFDDLHNPDDRRSHEAGRRAPRSGDGVRPITDREVPLGQRDGLVPALHAWLDGDLPEAAVRKGEFARDVEFWNRLNVEAAQLRHMRTPAGVEDRIMAALPATPPQMISPWYQREFVMTPAAAVTAGAVLVAVAAAVTVLVLSL